MITLTRPADTTTPTAPATAPLAHPLDAVVGALNTASTALTTYITGLGQTAPAPDPGAADPDGEPTGITHVLFVIDMSGSMADLAGDVRGGFNAYVTGMDGEPGKYRVTVTVFDSAYERSSRPQIRCVNLCTAAPLDQVPQLTEANYMPNGGTPLLDAIGKTIVEFEAATTLGEGDRVLLIVQTDGQENTSKEFTAAKINTMITEREAGGRWSALFLGAKLADVAQAGSYGFQGANTVVVGDSGASTRTAYASMVGSTRSFAAGGTGADAAKLIKDATEASE